MWIDNKGEWTFEDGGVRIELEKGDKGYWIWTSYVQHGEAAPWEMHDHGRADSLEAAKADAEGSVFYNDRDYHGHGDDYDGDHGTALMSAGYGDESFGYECGEWL